MTRIFLIAGESSGDIHGANLVRALDKLEPDITCEGIGGRRMEQAGMTLRFDLAERGIMGFTEVVRSFRTVRRLFYDTLTHLTKNPPSCVVLIDYPGFNIQMAKRLKQAGIPIVYYISPQVWAWKRGRIRILARTVDRMLVILPFEKELYQEAGLPCTYVGHPLLDHIATAPIQGLFRDGLVIGLLPGSREQEIRRIMATMLEVAKGIQRHYPEARFVVPCVDEQRETQVLEMAGDFPLETVINGMYEVLDGARFCMVASGTATLETALFKVPMLILYRVTELTYQLARLLVRVDHIGMVNILANRRVVPEFIQSDARVDKVLPVALELIADTPARKAMLEHFATIRETLGDAGASERAAREVLDVAHAGASLNG